MDSLLGRLSERLGTVRVFRARNSASYKPERSWERHFGEPERQEWVAPESAERPLRLLPKPEAIQTGPGNVSIRGHAYAVSAWKGPERICGEWWSEDFKRDYFQVLTRDERLFWVFKDLRTGGFFLHGVFD